MLSNLVLTLVNKILFSKPCIVSYDRECAVSNIDKTDLILMVNRVDMTCHVLTGGLEKSRERMEHAENHNRRAPQRWLLLAGVAFIGLLAVVARAWGAFQTPAERV